MKELGVSMVLKYSDIKHCFVKNTTHNNIINKIGTVIDNNYYPVIKIVPMVDDDYIYIYILLIIILFSTKNNTTSLKYNLPGTQIFVWRALLFYRVDTRNKNSLFILSFCYTFFNT